MRVLHRLSRIPTLSISLNGALKLNGIENDIEANQLA